MDLGAGTEQPQDAQWIDFSYAVAALSIDVVEKIVTLHPHVVNQPGKNFVHSPAFICSSPPSAAR